MSPTPSIRLITEVVAEYYAVERFDMLSQRRTHALLRPRQVAMYLARRLTPKSLPEIGLHMGGRDHTTVLHGCRRIEARLETEPVLAAEVEQIGTAIAAAEASLGLLRIPPPQDIEVKAVAARVLDGDGRAVVISLDELRALAAAVLSETEMAEASAAVVAAARAYIAATEAMQRANPETMRVDRLRLAVASTLYELKAAVRAFAGTDHPVPEEDCR